VSAEADRLAEIANICAGNAAGALASLLDAILLTELPSVHRLPAGRALAAVFAREDRVAAVFAELDGALPAQAALLLSATAVDEVLARVAGKRADETSQVSTLSVLAEVGNIAVSAAANALAELLGARSLPSVPRAGYTRQGVLAMPELERGALIARTVLEVELVERGGPLRLRFVLVPAGAAID
jgi:chemotaxis protein CheY-P-specific phosphatase CheC